MRFWHALRFIIVILFFVLSIKFIYADTVTVTGSVAPKSSDFQVSISATPTSLNQNTNVTYIITYGSHLYYPAQLIIEAQWYPGTISGENTPSVDGLTYVLGSATLAYNNIPPVVDLINQKIRWTIPYFPSQTTNQTVQFTLRASSSFTGNSTVTLPVKVRLINPSYTTPDQTQLIEYEYNDSLESATPTQSGPTSTPTPGPTNTPAPLTPTPTQSGPTVTPTPTIYYTIPTSIPSITPIPQVKFTNIDVRSVTANVIRLSVQTSKPTILIAHYGTSPSNITNTMQSSGTELVLDGLSEHTTYYVLITAKTKEGNKISSEILKFTTGYLADQPQINPQTITFTSTDITLYTPPQPQTQNQTKNVSPTPPPPPNLVIPQNITYNFRFQLKNSKNIKKVQVVIRNKFVLGFATSVFAQELPDPNTQIVDLIETQDGVYEGRLKTPPTPGTYEAFARIYDTSGNIVEQKLADVTVSQPLRVLDVTTKNPIEAAQVTLYYLNKLTNHYQLLPQQIFPIQNPSYTDPKGIITFALPQGKYKVHVTAIGYQQKDVLFELGPNSGDYPAIYLKREPFNLLTTATYYFTGLQDILSAMKAYTKELATSIRFFELNALLVCSLLAFLSFFALSSSMYIPLHSLLAYTKHSIHIMATEAPTRQIIRGIIISKDTKTPVPSANVYLIDTGKITILSHTKSDSTGAFTFATLPNKRYEIEVMAEGFEPTIFRQSELLSKDKAYHLEIQQRQRNLNITEKTMIFINRLFGVAFGSLLLTSLFFQLALGYVLGWDKTIIFFILSILNLTIWIIHLTHLRSQKNIY